MVAQGRPDLRNGGDAEKHPAADQKPPMGLRQLPMPSDRPNDCVYHIEHLALPDCHLEVAKQVRDRSACPQLPGSDIYTIYAVKRFTFQTSEERSVARSEVSIKSIYTILFYTIL